MSRMSVQLNQRLVGNHYHHQHNKGRGSKYLHQRRNDFLVPLIPLGWTSPLKHGYGMYVASMLKGALKLRYLLLGGTIYGGMTLKKKYDHFIDSLPDLKWLTKYSGDKWSQFSTTFTENYSDVKNSIKIDTIKNGGKTLKQKYENVKDGLPSLKSLTEGSCDKWSQISKTLIKTGGAVKDYIKIEPRLQQSGAEKFDELEQCFHKSLNHNLRALKLFCLFLCFLFLCLVIF